MKRSKYPKYASYETARLPIESLPFSEIRGTEFPKEEKAQLISNVLFGFPWPEIQVDDVGGGDLVCDVGALAVEAARAFLSGDLLIDGHAIDELDAEDRRIFKRSGVHFTKIQRVMK